MWGLRMLQDPCHILCCKTLLSNYLSDNNYLLPHYVYLITTFHTKRNKFCAFNVWSWLTSSKWCPRFCTLRHAILIFYFLGRWRHLRAKRFFVFYSLTVRDMEESHNTYPPPSHKLVSLNNIGIQYFWYVAPPNGKLGFFYTVNSKPNPWVGPGVWSFQTHF